MQGVAEGDQPRLWRPELVPVNGLHADTLVQVMDAVRGTMTTQGPRIVRAELFPNISIGDAPVVKK